MILIEAEPLKVGDVALEAVSNGNLDQMMKQVIADTNYSTDKDVLRGIITKLLDGEYYDHTGLIYGFGHAVYTITDPRAELLRDLCKTLAAEQHCLHKYEFYRAFEDMVREMVAERRGKPIPTNVDFYSGFAYDMLGIPEDLFTPLFAIARVAGWVAHNMENKLYDGKIMRPATKYVGEANEFVPLRKR